MNDIVYTQRYNSPIGAITLACREDAVIGLWFEGQKHFGSTVGSGAVEASSPVLSLAAEWLDIYFSGVEPQFTPPVRFCGTPFCNAVWNQLLSIPYGSTVSYKDIASGLALVHGGSMPSFRAVGAAVGRNPVSLIVPCHRVVGSDGSLRGYAGGLDRKAWLLELEHRLHG